MSIFTKPISQIVTADLEELLSNKDVENIRLEFKSEAPNKGEMLKKLSSFANTYGGIMVVGAKANSADGRIESVPGVDEQSGYKQKVIDWCFAGANPPLTVEVSDPIRAMGGAEKVCYVIRVEESDVAPHFLNGRKGVWVRTDEFSSHFEAQLANDNELCHLLDRRKHILARRTSLIQRAKQRYEYALRTGLLVTLEKGPTLEMCVVPRFPSRPLCEQSNLDSLILNNRRSWRAIQFPRANSAFVSQHESRIVLEPATKASIFEVNIWGLLFYGTPIAEADADDPRIFGVHLYAFVGHILLLTLNACAMLRTLGYTGPVYIETSLNSVRDIPWFYSNSDSPGIKANPGSMLDDQISFAITTSVESLHREPGKIVSEMLRHVLYSVNCACLVDTEQKVEQLIRKGYEYNGWPQSE